jgi:hypothetical protein
MKRVLLRSPNKENIDLTNRLAGLEPTCNNISKVMDGQGDTSWDVAEEVSANPGELVLERPRSADRPEARKTLYVFETLSQSRHAD